MSGWIECATPGCPGDMRYAAPGRGHIPGCTAPVTASDVRPPSDTGTTGWAIDPSGNIHRQGGGCYSTHCRPVLVVDPAEAHEPLADLIAHHDAYRVNDDGWVVCICGNVAEGDDDDGSHARHVTELILAALAGQGQP